MSASIVFGGPYLYTKRSKTAPETFTERMHQNGIIWTGLVFLYAITTMVWKPRRLFGSCLRKSIATECSALIPDN